MNIEPKREQHILAHEILNRRLIDSDLDGLNPLVFESGLTKDLLRLHHAKNEMSWPLTVSCLEEYTQDLIDGFIKHKNKDMFFFNELSKNGYYCSLREHLKGVLAAVESAGYDEQSRRQIELKLFEILSILRT